MGVLQGPPGPGRDATRPTNKGREFGFSTDGSVHPQTSAEAGAEKNVARPGDGGGEEAATAPPTPTPKNDGDGAEAPPMSGWSFHSTMLSAVLGSLLIAFNGTVLGTAIPSITSEFGTVDDVGWYASAYLIANCAMSPLVGRLYSTFRIKVMFITFVAIFMVGSLLAALAPSSTVLIIGRAISGVGGSGILNGGQTIIAATVPIGKRSFINGILLGGFALGQAVGPLIGGALTQALTWRWCFYINLPIGGAVILMFLLVVRLPVARLSDKKMTLAQRVLEIDLVGFFTFAAACSMFLMGLQWGGTQYAWDSPTVIGLLAAGLVCFGLLAGWFYYKGEDALIPPRLLRKRVTIMITLTSFVQSGATITALYWLPVWFQAIRGANALSSGVMILPLILSQLFGSVICGALVQKTGYYLPEVVLGNALVAVGAGLTSTFSPSTSTGEVIGYQILMGFGRGLILQLLVTAMQANVPREDASIASAYAMFSQFLGGAFFACIAKTVFTSSITEAVREHAPGIDPGALVDTGVTELTSSLPPEALEGALLAYNEAIDHVFYLQLAAACCAFVTGWGMGFKNLKTIRDDQKEEEANEASLVAQRTASNV
ncbi:MFS general substrate transporter [Xylariomycetidae sp. FL2044]|nr:MFS general substrate transporter [Xylariomycetidae sp. FL2044]